MHFCIYNTDTEMYSSHVEYWKKIQILKNVHSEVPILLIPLQEATAWAHLLFQSPSV